MRARTRPSLALLALLVPLAAWPGQQVEADDAIWRAGVIEQEHAVELTPGPEGVTLEVTRRFFNPTPEHGKLDMNIDLPCSATLDRFELRGRDDARGREVWAAARIVDPDAGYELFEEHMSAPEDAAALEGDTLALLTRERHFGCSAQLELYPVPPFGERSVRYRVFFPSDYEEGRHRVELPRLGLTNSAPQIAVHAPAPGLELAIDSSGKPWPKTLDGGQPHTLTLTRSDPSQATLELASIDLAQIGGSDARVSMAQLEIPRQLADLPALRRVVVVVDASHSFDAEEREQAQKLVAQYLGALEPEIGVELLTFDRELMRVYGGFVPAAWAAEDLAKLELETRNGSEVGKALAAARALLTSARREGDREGVDWIVLISDLDLRRGFDLEAELGAAAASDVRMHVVQGKDDQHPLQLGARAGEWMGIAQAAGGAHFVQGGQLNEADGLELLAPSRVWDLELRLSFHDGAMFEPLRLDLHAGQAHRWLRVHEAATITEIEYRGFVWAGTDRWRAKLDAVATRRWAGRLAVDEELPIELADPDRAALASFAEVLSPFTALLAEARFDGRSPGPSFAHGISYCGGGSASFSSRCGGVFTQGVGPLIPADLLESLIGPALAECEQLGGGRLEFELRGREIVGVAADDRCAEQVAWDLDLRPWALPDALVQVEYGPQGLISLASTPDSVR